MKKKQVLSAACIAALTSARVASATDYFSTFNTAVAQPASWSNAANWTNNPATFAYPNNGDDIGDNNTYEATVNGVGVGTSLLTLSEDITVSSLSFTNAALLGGSASGAGYSLYVLGAFNNGNGKSFRLSGGARLYLNGTDTITGAATIDGDSNSAINIGSSGTFTATSTGLTAISIPFNNYGAVSVTGGTLSLQGGGSGTGNFTVSSGAALEIASTNYYTGPLTNFTGGAVANDGTLNISRFGNATFGTISGTGTLNVPSYPATLNATRITQGTMNVDGGTITLHAPSTVTNLNLASATSNPVFYGSATDNTTAPSSTVSLDVDGVFNSTANLTLNNGFILNLAGTGEFGGNNIDGGTNAAINILAGAVIKHTTNTQTNIVTPLTSVAGELDVTAGTFNVYYGGTNTGSINLSASTYASVGGAFTATAKVSDSGTFVIIPSAGGDSDRALPGYTGHNFSGTMTVQPGATLGFQGVGLPNGIVYFTNQSSVTMGPTTSLNVVSGGGVYFNNPQALTIGTATFGGSAIFRNPGLTIGTLNVAGSGPTNIQFQNTGTITAGTLNLSGGILRTGQEANLATTLSVGTFNFTGGEESGKVVVNNTMTWTGGVIDADYGHVIVQPGATLNISQNGGSISQSGVLENNGNIYTANNLTVASADSSTTVVNLLAGSNTTVSGNIVVGNSGTISGGSSSASGTINIAAPASAKLLLLGNVNGGAGAANLTTGANVNLNGVSLNDATVSGGSLTVTTDTNTADNINPVLNGSIVGGYQRDGALNVNGGNVNTPFLKLGVTSGNTGTFTQTAGTVNVGILGAGNDGTITTGSDGSGISANGQGMINISGGTLMAGTVVLASTHGGGGDMNISGTANVIVGGGINGGGAHLNDITVNGGTLTVLDTNPQAGEDSELNRAIVGGYLTDGQLNVNGGVVTTPYLKLGITSGNTGTFTQTAGTVNVGTLGVGDDASLTSGSGVGQVNISGGTLVVGTVLLASTAGGKGDMTISGTANVTIGGGGNAGGGAHLNDLTLDGGTLTILDQMPPAGEDGELNRALVGGYLTSGAFNVYGGTASTPYIKLGISSGYTGTFVQQAGTVGVGTLCIGCDVTQSSGSGIGSVALSGGTLSIGTLLVGSSTNGVGAIAISNTAKVSISKSANFRPGNTLSMTGGTLTLENAPLTLPTGTTTISGSGGSGNTPVLHLHNSAVSAGNLAIGNNATLDGGGSDVPGESVGSVLLSGVGLSFSSGATLHLAIGGGATPGTTFDQITESGAPFAAGGTLQLLPLSGALAGKVYPIIVSPTGSIDPTKTFAVKATDPSYAGGNTTYDVTYSATEIDVTFTSIVPEPTAGLILFGGALLARRRRHRR